MMQDLQFAIIGWIIIAAALVIFVVSPVVLLIQSL